MAWNDGIVGVELTERDLASAELWTRSLDRSRHRRDLAALSRRAAPKRKGASVALSAAVAATPVLPGLAAARDTGRSVGSPVGISAFHRGGSPRGFLEIGSTGPAVRAVQRELRIPSDGIFGPQTRTAVRIFQQRVGLRVTGQVDIQTWMALFRSRVVLYQQGTQTSAGALPGGRTVVPPSPSVGVQRRSGGRATAPRHAATSPLARERQAPFQFKRPGPAITRKGPHKRTQHLGPAASMRPVERQVPAPQPDDQVPARSPGPRSTISAPRTPSSMSPVGSCGGSVVAPVRGTVTGVFGEQRPGHRHSGIDLAAPMSTPIHAAACGRVTQRGVEGEYGNLVCIQHAGGVSTCYAHLSGFAVPLGAQVDTGQIIGYVGCTGNCSGPHVHFEVRVNGTPRDPQPYLVGRSTIPREARRSAVRVSSSGARRTNPYRRPTATHRSTWTPERATTVARHQRHHSASGSRTTTRLDSKWSASSARSVPPTRETHASDPSGPAASTPTPDTGTTTMAPSPSPSATPAPSRSAYTSPQPGPEPSHVTGQPMITPAPSNATPRGRVPQATPPTRGQSATTTTVTAPGTSATLANGSTANGADTKLSPAPPRSTGSASTSQTPTPTVGTSTKPMSSPSATHVPPTSQTSDRSLATRTGQESSPQSSNPSASLAATPGRGRPGTSVEVHAPDPSLSRSPGSRPAPVQSRAGQVTPPQ